MKSYTFNIDQTNYDIYCEGGTMLYTAANEALKKSHGISAPHKIFNVARQEIHKSTMMKDIKDSLLYIKFIPATTAPFTNENRSRYYGKRIGDIVKLTCIGDTYGLAEVIGWGSNNNELVVRKEGNTKDIKWDAESCEIVTKVEQKVGGKYYKLQCKNCDWIGTDKECTKKRDSILSEFTLYCPNCKQSCIFNENQKPENAFKEYIWNINGNEFKRKHHDNDLLMGLASSLLDELGFYHTGYAVMNAPDRVNHSYTRMQEMPKEIMVETRPKKQPLNPELNESLTKELKHIFEIGANEIRVKNMLAEFVQRNYTLTPEEMEIVDMTADIYNKFMSLDRRTDQDSIDIAGAIHLIQRIIMARLARRVHPTEFRQ